MDSDFVALPGPPFVRAIADSNIFTVPEKLNTRLVITIGRRSGRRMFLNNCHPPQPSILAASRISSEISRSAP